MGWYSDIQIFRYSDILVLNRISRKGESLLLPCWRWHSFETVLWPTYSNKPFNVICQIHTLNLCLNPDSDQVITVLQFNSSICCPSCLFNDRMVEWWNGGMVEWSNGRVVVELSRQIGGRIVSFTHKEDLAAFVRQSMVEQSRLSKVKTLDEFNYIAIL